MQHHAAPCLKVRKCSLGVDEGAADVDVHHAVVGVQRRVEHAGLHADPRVVHEDVEATEQRDGLVDAGACLIGIGRVGAEESDRAA